MSQPMERCENCLKQFPESKIATHFGYCRRNIKKCADCGEMYDINCQEEHEEQFHKKAACQFCKKQFGVAELEKHKNTCSQKTKYCQYCELNVPINQYSSHLKACESRTKACDKCRKPIANKDYLIHLTTCKGITEEPRGYNDYINNQRSKDNREQIRQQYGRVQQRKQPQYKRQVDMRRRQAPTTSNPVYNLAPKPTVTPIQPSNTRQQQQYVNQPVSSQTNRQPVTNPIVNPTMPSSSSNSNNYIKKQGVTYSNNTYNPREISNVQHRDQKQPTRETVREAVWEVKRESVREGVREPVREYGRNAGGYGVAQPPVNIRTQVRTDVRTDNRVYQQRRDQNGYDRQPQRKQVPNSKPSNTGSYGNQPKYEAQKPIYPSSSNQIKKQVPKKAPIFDPTEYGGFSQQIPQQFLRSQRNVNNLGINDEDEQFQRVLIESMNTNQNKKKTGQEYKNMPKDFSSQELMNSSMVMDLDMERQRAAYEEMERKARKNRR